MSPPELPRLRAEEISPRFTITTPQGPREIDAYSEEGLRVLGNLWTRSGWEHKASYRFNWLGVPVIQMPEDVLVLQELLWQVRPDVVVESGVAHGGALILYASILELLGGGIAIGVDVEIRAHNREAMQSHPLAHRLRLIEGDSVAADTLAAVREQIGSAQRVLVALDSNHSREHVRAELEAYAPLISPGSYLVVFDSVMALVADAPRGEPGWASDNPLEAVREFLAEHPEFEWDPSWERIPGATYASGGFLRRSDSADRD